MYGIVAPGLKIQTSSAEEVRRILALYPYAKVRRFSSEEQCGLFLAANLNNHTLDEAACFGDVFESHAVKMEYFIHGDLYCNFYTAKLGNVRVNPPADRPYAENLRVENAPGLAKIKITGLNLPDTIPGHMQAIYRCLTILGPLPDVDIVVPDHSIFYCLWNYEGVDRNVRRVRNLIRERLGNIALSLRRYGNG